MSNIDKKLNEIKYVDLNGLKVFAKELKSYLKSHILEISIYNELKDRIEAIENQDFYRVVESYDNLPNPGLEKIIYLVPDNGDFAEYLWIRDRYEQLGTFTPQLSLDQYLKIEDSPFEKGDVDNSAVLKGGNNIASSSNAIAFGLDTKASGEASHAEGYSTHAAGGTSHAEGYDTGAGGASSHAEGMGTEATGCASHAEGYYTDAKADYAHSEGQETRALSFAAHAEGYNTEAKKYAHAEGNGTFANGESSHAEGRETEANGKYSHAEGFTTITYNEAEHASGKYNNSVEKTESNTTADATLFSIGIGESKKKRKNAFEVKQNGDVYINGITLSLAKLLSTADTDADVESVWNEL